MNRSVVCRCVCLGILLTAVACAPVVADEFPQPVNTQAPGEGPPTPQEMLPLFDLPDGFSVTLFAGEPDVRQPIAFDFDDRGRLWVAENYTYNRLGDVDPTHRDRIVILEDTDHDGQHDVRKVFWDQGSMLTGLTWGYGGLWILNDGTLSVLPDEDGDDVPDSEPVELLNGWTKTAGHNFVNGLLWGPDGWLYGRHGITDSSLPGAPDTPEHERRPMNCGVWRFHPVTHQFEIVCEGTTNPWGLDYDRRGQMFLTNNVIGHLWHVIPGAHYERMFGQDFNPHLYELMQPCSDHYHWDHTGKWTESRDGKADDLGGGHSHCGGMIYLGNSFPEQYRGQMFMNNIHGRCVNVELIRQHGSSYVASHEPNFLKVNTPWFRGIELRYGPAGCVYLSDWSDNGECHDRDGVHRTSGRIYRIAWDASAPTAASQPAVLDPRAGSRQLLRIALLGDNEWTRRRAMRVVMEHTAAGRFDPLEQLQRRRYYPTLLREENELLSIRAAWLLLAVNAVAPDQLKSHVVLRCLVSRFEHVRAIGVRIIAENPRLQEELGHILASRFRNESSLLVRMSLAAALQKLPFDEETSLGASVASLLTTGETPPLDAPLRQMIWYGIEPGYQHFTQAAQMTDSTLRQHYTRRMASNWNLHRDEIGEQLHQQSRSTKTAESAAMLRAILNGLRGQRQMTAPSGWAETSEALRGAGEPELTRLVDELSAVFGDGAALADLRNIVADRDGDHTVRSRAIAALSAAQDEEALPVLLNLLSDRAVYVDVAKALAVFDDPQIPKELLKRWKNLRHGSRDAAIDTLVSRRAWATAFVRAVADGRVDPHEISAGQVRRLLAYQDSSIAEVVETHWGMVNESSEEKEATIAGLRASLTTDVLQQADLSAGAALFKKTCASCHKLYGDGGVIGPDLTGANRGNLDYLLSNIVAPSAVVPRQFTVSVLVLTSGQNVTGVVIAESDSTVTVQTDKEQRVIALSDIAERVRTNSSLMPDGLLNSLNEQQIRDLIAFVMQRR